MQCECNEPKKSYINLKIINLIVPVPAFAGMTKERTQCKNTLLFLFIVVLCGLFFLFRNVIHVSLGVGIR